jgi:hypothetical protein
MTVAADSFPIGYFYIISKLNGMALDIDMSEGVKVSNRL